jgi:hypothetical protein
LYIATNAAASAAVLLAINIFGWTFGGGTPAAIKAYQVLVAGLGAAALFRSNLFLVKIGGKDVGVGPSLLLTAILEAADRGVDRTRAKRRAYSVSSTMVNVSFEKAWEPLPEYCLALLQNVGADDRVNLTTKVSTLRASTMLDQQKALILGLNLMNIGGAGVLSAGVEALRSTIGVPQPSSNGDGGHGGGLAGEIAAVFRRKATTNVATENPTSASSVPGTAGMSKAESTTGANSAPEPPDTDDTAGMPETESTTGANSAPEPPDTDDTAGMPETESTTAAGHATEQPGTAQRAPAS